MKTNENTSMQLIVVDRVAYCSPHKTLVLEMWHSWARQFSWHRKQLFHPMNIKIGTDELLGNPDVILWDDLQWICNTPSCLTPSTLTSVCIFSLLSSIKLFDINKENWFDNQELYKLAIISFILMTSMFVSLVIKFGEIRCQSPSGVKWLMIY